MPRLGHRSYPSLELPQHQSIHRRSQAPKSWRLEFERRKHHNAHVSHQGREEKAEKEKEEIKTTVKKRHGQARFNITLKTKTENREHGHCNEELVCLRPKQGLITSKETVTIETGQASSDK